MRLLVALLLSMSLVASGQSVPAVLGARAAGMGYSTALLTDAWGIFNNPGGMSAKHTTAIGSVELRPTLDGATKTGAGVVHPIKNNMLGVAVFSFGDGVYSENLATIGYANNIGNTSLGARLTYIQYRAQSFGTQSALGLSVGGITKINSFISAGAWVQNINQPKLNKSEDQRAPMRMAAGLAFKPSEKFLITTEVEKDIELPAIYKVGFENTILKKFAARAGFNLNPNAFFFGIGYQAARIKIDYAFQGLVQVGAAHQASFSYRFGKLESLK